MRKRSRNTVVGGVGCVPLLLVATLAVGPAPETVRAQSPAAVDLAHVPAGASFVGYVNVRDAMLSDVWARIRAMAGDEIGPLRIEELGLDLEQDIDEILGYVAPGASPDQPKGLGLFRGRFDMTRLEAVARAEGASVDDHNGTRLISVSAEEAGTIAIAALEPGVLAVGDLATVQRAIDRQSSGTDVTSNDEMMARLAEIDGGSDIWAVGRISDLSALGVMPDDLPVQMPAVTAFAMSGNIDSGVSGAISIEGRDEETGQHLRDLLRGVRALFQSQAANNPEIQLLVDSVVLGGAGNTATVSFNLQSETLDTLFAAAHAQEAQ